MNRPMKESRLASIHAINGRRTSKREEQRLMAMRDGGIPLKECCAQLGISGDQANKIIRRALGRDGI